MRFVVLASIVILLAGCAGERPPTPTTNLSPINTPSTPATPSVAPANPLQARLIPSILNVTPGHSAATLVQLRGGRGGSTATATITGAGIKRVVNVTLASPAIAGAWATIEIPNDIARGNIELDLNVDVDGQRALEAPGALRLHVLDPGVGFRESDTAELLYFGRITDTGEAFNTNDNAYEGAVFPETSTFRASPGVLTAQGHNVVPGFWNALLGMQVNESRTVHFPPELGYGPATTNESISRDQTVDRVVHVPNAPQTVGRLTFDAYINETHQGDASSYHANDTFNFSTRGNPFPYRIVAINDTVVRFRLAPMVGQNYTIYPFWANASEALVSNDTEVAFRTTPTTAAGEAISFRTEWPNMSALASFNDTTIVIHHSPPVGLVFNATSGGATIQETVVAVNDTAIVVAKPSASALAGKDLTFDIRIVDIRRG